MYFHMCTNEMGIYAAIASGDMDLNSPIYTNGTVLYCTVLNCYCKAGDGYIVTNFLSEID